MSEYVEFLTGHLARLGPVEPRRMFGGFGIFHQGLMFALVVDDPEEAERWARASCAAALRAVKRGVSGKPRRPK